MYRSHVLLLMAIIVLFTLALHSVSTLLSLLVEDAAHDVIQPSELLVADTSANSSLPLQQPIPKIIHQTYANTSIPERWRKAQQSCIQLHADYEYKFWTDDDSAVFIEKEYPWFLDTYLNYPHNIQRADAIRYFILAHYGGVYIDLDSGCRQRLDLLLQFPAWLHITIPTGISNDGMGASPRHAFFLYVIDQLQAYDRSWILSYLTVMSTTGPLFLSIVWKKYMALHLKENVDWSGRVRVLTPAQYSELDSSFFEPYGGSSWHGNDARAFLWMGDHWLLVTVTGFSIGAFFGLCIWWIAGHTFQPRKLGDHVNVGLERRSPRLLHRSIPRPYVWGTWNWHSWKANYEVVEHHVV
jgi:inositol phosphorylceramide mannosyltransferase catalytic subunit